MINLSLPQTVIFFYKVNHALRVLSQLQLGRTYYILDMFLTRAFQRSSLGDDVSCINRVLIIGTECRALSLLRLLSRGICLATEEGRWLLHGFKRRLLGALTAVVADTMLLFFFHRLGGKVQADDGSVLL